jgi:myo-inositol 2-dehydrogenase/D-chiro-inositol 1-dehydrogenase
MALIGAGRIGQVHVVNLSTNPRIELTCIVEPDERGQKMAEQYNVLYFTTLTAALAHEKEKGVLLFEGVVICTPTITHTDLIKESLNADKHVFCEKPIGHDVKTVDSVYELAEKKGKHMLTGFQRRFDPSFVKLRDAVRNGSVGKVHKVRSTSRDNPFPSMPYLKISGGLVHDCASHDLDLVRWVVGKDPISVYAVGVTHDDEIRALGDIDSIDISLVFPDNILGSVDVTRLAVYGYDQRLEALGDGGIANSYNYPQTSFVLGNDKGFHSDVGLYSFPTRYREAYANELDHFVDLCLGVTDVCEVSAKDLHNLTKIMDAACESCKTGKVVTIDYS